MASSSIILATTSNFAVESEDSRRLLEDNGFTLVVNPFGRVLSEDELIELLDKYRPAGLLAGTEKISRLVMERSKEYLQVVSRVGVGADNVDLSAAQEYGIPVFRTMGILAQPVAELTIALILSALRHVCEHDRVIRSGIWKKRMGGLLSKRTLGLIGFGNIGQRVGELACAFGARIVYFDIYPKQFLWAESLSFNEVLKQSDIISIHASGKQTLLSNAEMQMFAKAGCILVNTARGNLVDEEALYEFLADGRITHACLDVFRNEPYTGPLSKLENVTLSPHVGSSARESRIEMEIMAVNNLITCLKNQ